MLLPFLKEKKWPRIAKPMDEKSIGLSASDKLEEFCIEELMMAVANKDVPAFRKAIEALVLNCFDMDDDDGEPDAA